MPDKERYDVALYGHITVDRILSGFHESKTIGAIGNVWGALVLTNENISIDIKPTAIKHTSQGERKSFKIKMASCYVFKPVKRCVIYKKD